MDIAFEPIGVFHGAQKERYHVARQGGIIKGAQGTINLFSRQNYEQALEGVEGFDHLWVIYRFNRNKHWKPKVMPPRGNLKRGVFATRSPHRPNFIGLSRVRLLEVRGLVLTISDHDLLDGTPILDIKPFINYCDAVPSQNQGWIDELDETIELSILWSQKAKEQVNFLLNEGVDIPAAIEARLLQHPFPRKSNRIKKLKDDRYLIAYKSWRIDYQYRAGAKAIEILDIYSGYREDELYKGMDDRWGDFSIHKRFNDAFIL